MTIYVDNNISYRLARALDHLSSGLTRKLGYSIDIQALRDSEFGHDAPDETWIPVVGQRGDWMFTQDVNIRRMAQQRALLEAYGTNVIFLQSSNATAGYWRMVQRTVTAWPAVIELITQGAGQRGQSIEIDLRDRVSLMNGRDST